jgi:hypothetical protein
MRDSWTVCAEDGIAEDAGGDGARTGVAKKSAVSDRGFDGCLSAGGGDAGRLGDGGRVEKGDAKKALVFELGGDDDEEEDAWPEISEKVESREEVVDEEERAERRDMAGIWRVCMRGDGAERGSGTKHWIDITTSRVSPPRAGRLSSALRLGTSLSPDSPSDLHADETSILQTSCRSETGSGKPFPHSSRSAN